MHHPTYRITHTTAFVTPVVEHSLEQEIAQWVPHEESIRRPIAPWANALTTELHLAPLHMETRKCVSVLEPVRRCEPSTYQPINRWHSHCVFQGRWSAPGSGSECLTCRFRASSLVDTPVDPSLTSFHVGLLSSRRLHYNYLAVPKMKPIWIALLTRMHKATPELLEPKSVLSQT